MSVPLISTHLAHGPAGLVGMLSPTLASIAVGPVQFDSPIFLVLLPLVIGVVLWISRRNLSGLSSTSRKVAIGVRVLLLTLIVLVLAEPQTRKTSEDVSVTAIVDVSRSIPAPLLTQMDSYISGAAAEHKRTADRLGVLTVGRQARVQDLPSVNVMGVERRDLGPLDGSNLASAVRLAMAVMPKDAANRITLLTDGNETEGSLLQAAEAARAAGIQIDVLPIRYDHESEVVVERMVAPATARMGETVALKVVLTSTARVSGRLSILQNGTTLDLDPDSASLSMEIELDPGVNVKMVPLTLVGAGPQEFEAIFEPISPDPSRPADAILENNRALAVTFVSGQGRTLVVTSSPAESQPLMDALVAGRIDALPIGPEQFPGTLTELNGFDAIVLVNQSAYNFTQSQQQNLRNYVHDSGGGLVMMGGPDSFGAGGWIGSPIEEALPVRLDPPQKRQMPRGALVLIVHSVEMPSGVFYGRQVSNAAIDALSRLDLGGIIEFSYSGGTDWVHPLQEVGDKSSLKQAINRLVFGDMQDFGPSMNLALQGLLQVNAGQKHIIMISDGDPSLPSPAMLTRFREGGISISTVGVFPHSPADTLRMSQIAEATGGNHYEVNTDAALALLPQIFIKEAQTVRRSLIWEGSPFSPQIVDSITETMRGVTSVPPISGYVVTADREGLSVVTLRGQENDPISAQWQFGLGRVVAFTGDATTRWSPSWVSWGGYRSFWQQHVRWAMRPSGSANIRVTTENRGAETLISIDALDQNGERLNFAQFQGRLSRPDGRGDDVQVQQVGPGRYEARVSSEDAGTYLLGLRYAARSDPDAPVMEGSVQAAITRPFADEFRALRDNSPLLRQIAEMTGGQVLEADPRRVDLWRRDGLKMPVAITPLWMPLILCGVALFLTDVGIRRVRVDPVAIGRRIAALFGRATVKQGAQMETLQAVRLKARSRLDEAERATRKVQGGGAGMGGMSGGGGMGGGKPEGGETDQTSSRKFEAVPGTRVDGPSPISKVRSGDAPAPAQPPKTPEKGPTAEEGMSALMKAKKRAQERIDDQSRPSE